MSRIRNLPALQKDQAKFFITSFMMIATIYVYSILKGVKDTLIISELGAELISTLKLYGVLPAAILFMLLYTKLINTFTRIHVYHFLNIMFITYFVLFDLVLYPNAKELTYDASSLIEKYPFLKYHLIMVTNWVYSLFYIMSEMWGAMMLSLMFWQITNQINTLNQAKKIYPLFGVFGQIGLLISGVAIYFFTDPTLNIKWRSSLHYISLSIFIAGLLLSISLHVLSEHIVGVNMVNGVHASKKNKVSMMESLKYIMTSKYIGLITILILCYGTSINLVEGVWKKQASLLYHDPVELCNYMGKIQISTGIFTFLAIIFASFFLSKFNWKTVALVTPIMMLVTGIPFFLLTIYEEHAQILADSTGVNVLFVIVMVGGLQNILSRACKYAFFDPTKEMSYIPLDEELRAKGQAVAEVIGGRIGKSSGAIIQWAMLTFTVGSTLISITTNLFATYVVTMVVWIIAVLALSKEFKKRAPDEY